MYLFYCFYREFLAGVPPPLAKAIGFYKEENRLVIEQGDMIALIDERPDLNFIKGQNQRSFDIGTFPRFVILTKIYEHGSGNSIYLYIFRNIVESAGKCKGSAADISRPVHESFRHTGHGSPFGASWGSPACLRPLSPTDNSGSLRGKNNS